MKQFQSIKTLDAGILQHIVTGLQELDHEIHTTGQEREALGKMCHVLLPQSA
jgi:hypothetical protein